MKGLYLTPTPYFAVPSEGSEGAWCVVPKDTKMDGWRGKEKRFPTITSTQEDEMGFLDHFWMDSINHFSATALVN